jgi:uncharacterized protein YqeY
MGVKEDLIKSLHSAMKEKNTTRKNAIRLALSAIKLAETEKGIEKDTELDQMKIFSILQKEIKIREETIAEAVKADREGMIAPLNNEIKVLKEFLPSELTEKELIEEINKVISDLNATTIKQMGLVMKTVIENVQGRASNDRISKIARNLLSQIKYFRKADLRKLFNYFL